jgi:hypothetical protein
MISALGAGALTSVMAIACANGSEDQTMPPVVLGMLDTTPPSYDDGQTQIYSVTTQVQLPMRRPNDGERPKGNVDPYPEAPFVLAKDTRISVRFTLSNLEDKPVKVELLVDPWNEFVHYEPGIVIGDEMTSPNFSGIDRFYVLPPRSRIEGILTPDDMVELATDLATAMKIAKTPPAADSQFAGPALYNRAFNIQNRSSQPDVVLAGYIPQTIDGLTGFDLGLRIRSDIDDAQKAAKVAVEIVVDVEDMNGDRVIKDGDTSTKPIRRPGTALTPPAPPATP